MYINPQLKFSSVVTKKEEKDPEHFDPSLTMNLNIILHWSKNVTNTKLDITWKELTLAFISSQVLHFLCNYLYLDCYSPLIGIFLSICTFIHLSRKTDSPNCHDFYEIEKVYVSRTIFLSADTETDQNDDIEPRLEKLEFRHARLDAYLPVTDSANVVEFACTL